MKVLFIMLLVLPITIFAQKAVEPKTPKEKAEALLTAIQIGSTSAGYDQFFLNKCPGFDKSQDILYLKKQTDNALSLYGKILGYEFVKEETYGTSVVKLIYLLKSEDFFTVWTFHFYKPKETWLTAGVFFNSEFSSLK